MGIAFKLYMIYNRNVGNQADVASLSSQKLGGEIMKKINNTLIMLFNFGLFILALLTFIFLYR